MFKVIMQIMLIIIIINLALMVWTILISKKIYGGQPCKNITTATIRKEENK